MHPLNGPSRRFPRPEPEQARFRVNFERPSEAVVFWTLENLCVSAGGRSMLSLRKLARHCGLSVSTTNRAVLRLAQRGLVRYDRGSNQARPSLFEIPDGGSPDPSAPTGIRRSSLGMTGKSPDPLAPRQRRVARDDGEKTGRREDAGRGEKLPRGAGAVAKIGTPTSYDSDSDPSIDSSIGDTDRRDVHRKNEDSGGAAEERLAVRVADGLDDMKNLALYRSYCRRFPARLILTAYARAKEPSPDKIRVSRGALFNFLVQLYARKGTHNDSGSASR